MNRYSATLKVTTLVSLMLGWTMPGLACTKVPIGLSRASDTVPSDGLLVMTFGCDSEGTCRVDDLPALEVRDNSNADAEVLGTVVRKELVKGQSRALRWALWRPNTPFIAGHQYTVQALEDAGTPQTFTAVERDDFNPRVRPDIENLILTDDDAGSRVCCPTAGPAAICSPQSCFRTERTQKVKMTIAYYRTPEALEQWVFRSTHRAGDQITIIPDSPVQLPFVYENTPSGEYCYTLDAVHVVTGQVVRIGEECQQFPISEMTTEPASQEEVARYLQSCASPPLGYEALWQEGVDRKASSPDAGIPPTDNSGLRPDAGSPPTMPAVDLNSMSDSVTTTVHDEPGGCSLGRSSSARQSLYASLVLLALCVRRKRRDF